MAATVTQQLSSELAVVKKETAPVIQMATSLTIKDSQTYAVADTLLGKIVTARKTIKTRLGKFLTPLKESLDKAKEAYKEAQLFQDEAEGPLAEAEGIVRQRMKGYKLEEARQAQIEEQKREEEAAELRRQAQAKLLAESKAKTQAMKERLAAQRRELETQADIAEIAPAVPAVKVANSTVRRTRSPQVVNLSKFLEALLSGQIKISGVEPIQTLLKVDESALKALYKMSPETVASWPGIEIVEDVQIVHQTR